MHPSRNDSAPMTACCSPQGVDPSTVPGNGIGSMGGTSQPPMVAGLLLYSRMQHSLSGPSAVHTEVADILDRTAVQVFDGDDENTTSDDPEELQNEHLLSCSAG